MKVHAQTERWEMAEPFRISGETFTHAEIAVVTIEDRGVIGRGEACGVYYRGDTSARIVEQVAMLAPALAGGVDRAELQRLLPAGGARNALDAALWEVEAGHAGRPVWQLAGLAMARPIPTVFTIGIGTPAEMARKAAGMSHARSIKLKLEGGGEDGDRVRAVRAARPDADIFVDGNRGFDPDRLDAIMPIFRQAGIGLIEQPFEIGRDADLRHVDRTISIAADESVQDIGDLEGLIGLADFINIKLDKCGGLTHALEMERAARAMGFGVMVGNMTGTSWSQAPAFVLGQRCDLCDLDGPTFLARDREPGVRYDNGLIYCPDEIWGGGKRS
ncbi:MAG: dipeptide epimerase [Candidatus Sphingomonas phytovorans]|nr:dipeptide epimerase [Sphingomonas sp.]WEK00248.1 MAG: dipeptide epimerase [Sphingomonas sp.]